MERMPQQGGGDEIEQAFKAAWEVDYTPENEGSRHGYEEQVGVGTPEQRAAATTWAAREGIPYENLQDLLEKHRIAVGAGRTAASTGIKAGKTPEVVESKPDVPDFYLMEDFDFEQWLYHMHNNTPPKKVAEMKAERQAYRESLEEAA